MPSDLETELKQATQGLLYMSESDEPFEVIRWKGDGCVMDAQKLLALSGHKPKTPVQVVAVDYFFKDLIADKDWYGAEEKADVRKYQNLLRVLQEALSGIQMFRVGKTQVDIFIVGKMQDGDWAGVKTSAVET